MTHTVIVAVDGPQLRPFHIFSVEGANPKLIAACHLAFKAGIRTVREGMSQLSETDARRALIEQAHQLHELTKHPGWAILVDYMEVRMRGDKLKVLNGKCVDIDEYRTVAGRLVGMHAVLDAPKVVNEMAANARKRAAEHDENDAA